MLEERKLPPLSAKGAESGAGVGLTQAIKLIQANISITMRVAQELFMISGV
jgi:hypothetical protein